MDKLLNKYNKISVQTRTAIWFVICSLMQKGISFITVPIFTRLLTTEQYGTYSLYLSWLQILTIITSLYLYYGVFNNAMVKFENDKDRYISSMQGLTLTLNVVAFIMYLSAYNMWSDLLGLAPGIMCLMFLEMLITPALSFWSGRQRFEYKYRSLVVITILKSIANPVVGLMVVSLADHKDIARIFSVVLVEAIFCGTIMIRQFQKGKCFFHKEYWKYALGMAVPLLPHYLSGTILSQGDRVMISKLVGTSEVAFYSVTYSIGMLVQIFTNAVSNSFTPWMYQKIKTSDFKGISKIVNMLLMLIAVLALCLMLCSPELVLFFGSKEYASAVYVIPPVAASVFLIFLYNVFAIPQFYFEKTQFLLVSSITAAVANLGLNYIFIRLYGYVAAGYTTLVCYILYSLGHFIISKRVFQRNIPGENLYDEKAILLMSIIVIVMGVCCNFIFDYWHIRYGILLVTFIVAFVQKNKIIALVSELKKK